MKRYLNILFVLGALLLLAGALLMATGWELAPYLYCVGAVAVAAVQLSCSYDGPSVVLRRLYRQQMFGSIALLLAGVFMFTTRHNEWMVCLAVAAVLELYTAFRIPYIEEKEKKPRN